MKMLQGREGMMQGGKGKKQGGKEKLQVGGREGGREAGRREGGGREGRWCKEIASLSLKLISYIMCFCLFP